MTTPHFYMKGGTVPKMVGAALLQRYVITEFQIIILCPLFWHSQSTVGAASR